MKVLMVYENIPESTDVYLIDTDNVEHLNALKLSHGNYLNAAETDEIDIALNKINFFISNKDYITQEFADQVGEDISNGGQWLKFILPATQPVDIKDMNVDLLVITGFIM